MIARFLCFVGSSQFVQDLSQHQILAWLVGLSRNGTGLRCKRVVEPISTQQNLREQIQGVDIVNVERCRIAERAGGLSSVIVFSVESAFCQPCSVVPPILLHVILDKVKRWKRALCPA